MSSCGVSVNLSAIESSITAHIGKVTGLAGMAGIPYVTAGILAGMAASNGIRGIFGGGYNPVFSNVIDYITIASTGNAADFGDLIAGNKRSSGTSDSHGGLQG